MGVITISRGYFERCCSNKKTPTYHSNLNFVTLRNRRPTLLRAPAYRTPSEASPRRRCGHASRFLANLCACAPRKLAFQFSYSVCGGVCERERYTHVHIYTYTHTLIYIYTHTHTHIYIIYIYIQIYAHTHTHTYIYIYIYMYLYVYI